MRTFLTILATLTLVSALSAQPAAKTPEQLLPADSLLYFRYDGYEPHRKAYDRTALAQAMKEGLSEFFDHLFAQLLTLASGKGGAENAKQAPTPTPEIDRFLECLWKDGLALSVEMPAARAGAANAQDLFQITLVFPNGAQKKSRDALEAAFRLAARAAESVVEDAEFQGRKLRVANIGVRQAAWWPEGKHLVFTLGPQAVERAIRVIDGRRPNVGAAPWHRELAGFDRYETDMRGSVDLEKIVDHLAVLGLDAPAFANLKEHLTRQLLLRHLGLTGLKNLTFHLGFDGKYQRSTVRLGIVEPKQRSGLLKFVTGGFDFAPAKLPPLPPDSDYVSVRQVDWAGVFDFIRTSYGLLSIAELIEGQLPKGFPDLDRVVGGDFRKDFLDHLDTTLVSYGAHSEGPFFLGQGFAVKVKDAAKVRKGLAGIVKALGEIDPMGMAQKTKYRGEELYVLNRLPLPVTFAVHQDWLVFGLFPQPVQGFVLRSGGKYRTWKAPPELAEVLAKERREKLGGKLLSVSVSDPRPVIELGLALLPVIVQSYSQGGPQILDVSKIPNAQSVNEWLFPNICLVYDDGHAVRWENHYSINEPDDILLAMVSPAGAGMLNFMSRRIRTAEAAPAAPVPVVPRKIMPAPAPELKEPMQCSATAVEKEGAIQIELLLRREVSCIVYRSVSETRYKEVVSSSGQVTKVPYTVTRAVPQERKEQITERRHLTADGKTVRVTRKDGTAVDPKELPKLLAKPTQVLFVPGGEVPAEQRQKLADGTLIITATPSAPGQAVPTANGSR